MKISVFKSLKLLLLAMILSVSSASAEYAVSPTPPDTSGDSKVLSDGGIITPIDTMRSWIDYYDQVYLCLKECKLCTDSLCGFPCNEICDTLTNDEIQDSLDSGIISPTDLYKPVLDEITVILQTLYMVEKSAELKLIYLPRFNNTKNLSKIYFQNIELRKKYKSLLIRTRFLINNFELLFHKTAVKICNP